MERLHPDLLIGLAHGGTAPARATAYLWSLLSETSLPDVLYTNLGSEKYVRYESLRRTLKRQCFFGFSSPLEDVVHFLEWLPNQMDWIDEFRAQVLAATHGRTPETILVIDEEVSSGCVQLLALGMLHILFPQAVVYFVVGPIYNWRDALAWCWLTMEHPQVYRVLTDRLRQDEDFGRNLRSVLRMLAAGTGDAGLDSFRFEYLDEDAQCFAELGLVLPPAEWLSMQVWVEAQIKADIDWRVEQAPPDRRALFDEVRHVHMRDILWLRVLLAIRKWGSLTAAETAAMFFISRETATEQLETLVRITLPEVGSDGLRIVRSPSHHGLSIMRRNCPHLSLIEADAVQQRPSAPPVHRRARTATP